MMNRGEVISKPLTLEQLRGMEGQKVLLYRMKSTETLESGTVKQNGDVLGDADMLAYGSLPCPLTPLPSCAENTQWQETEPVAGIFTG